MTTKKFSVDLTKAAPRSPHMRLGGYAIIARTIDKCRATIDGVAGEYHFDCPLDNSLFTFKGIKGVDFKVFVESGATDLEIVEWVSKNGTPKTAAENRAWSFKVIQDNYSDKPEKKAWLEGELVKSGLDKDETLFTYLDQDDFTSYKH